VGGREKFEEDLSESAGRLVNSTKGWADLASVRSVSGGGENTKESLSFAAVAGREQLSRGGGGRMLKSSGS